MTETIREIQIAEALKYIQHGQRIKPYLQARQDWRASLPVRKELNYGKEKDKDIVAISLAGQL